MQLAGMSLIANELELNLPQLKLVAYTDNYKTPQEKKTIDLDQEFTQNLI
jgi:hypothetical protein